MATVMKDAVQAIGIAAAIALGIQLLSPVADPAAAGAHYRPSAEAAARLWSASPAPLFRTGVRARVDCEAVRPATSCAVGASTTLGELTAEAAFCRAPKGRLGAFGDAMTRAIQGVTIDATDTERAATALEAKGREHHRQLMAGTIRIDCAMVVRQIELREIALGLR